MPADKVPPLYMAKGCYYILDWPLAVSTAPIYPAPNEASLGVST